MSVVTDLTVTGKVAQFGRGVLADVSAKLLDQFVANLEATVLAEDLVLDALDEELEALTTDDPVAAAAAADDGRRPSTTRPRRWSTWSRPSPRWRCPTTPVVRRVDSADVEPVDLLGTAGAPVGKRLVGLAAVITALALIFGLGADAAGAAVSDGGRSCRGGRSGLARP